MILGAGQYGTVVKETALEMGVFDKINFLDDRFDNDNIDSGNEVIGRIDALDSLCSEYKYAIPAIGDADIRMKLIEKAEKMSYKIPCIISPRAYVSPSAHIGKGAVIEPLAGVHANAEVGAAAYISMGAAINHNAVVGDGCHVDNNAVVMSGAEIPAMVKVNPGVTVKRRYNVINIDNKGDLTIDA